MRILWAEQFMTRPLVAVLLLISPAAFASADESRAEMLGEIIVTASKRAERAQDVGASISVISAEDLQKRHVTGLQDLSATVPGLLISSRGGPGQSEIVLRGLNTQNEGALVATVIDDSAVGSSTRWAQADTYQLDLLPYDIERIELLRGPQGTLYGANSMGGVLKYVTKYPNLTAPEIQFGGEGFGISNGGRPGFGVRASLSSPLISERLGMRFSVYDQKTPGYIANRTRGDLHENEVSQRGGRLAMLWLPMADLSIRAQAVYQRNSSDGNSVAQADQLASADDPYFRPGAGLGSKMSYDHPLPEPFLSEVKYFSISANWHLAFADFISASAYSDKLEDVTADGSAQLSFLLPVFDPAVTAGSVRLRTNLRAKRFSQEFRLSSPSGVRLEWLAGLYFSDERTTNNQFADALDNGGNLDPTLNPFAALNQPSTYTESALFGSVTYKLTDAWDVTAGVRALKNRQRVDLIFLPSVFYDPSNAITRSDENKTNYAFGTRYHFGPNTMVYGRIASGYRPGGPNLSRPDYPEIPSQTKSDTMVDYEVGLKTDFFNRRAALDVAIYRINWTDLQAVASTSDGALAYSINAGRVVSEGIELSVVYIATPKLQLSLSGAFNDAYATQANEEQNITVGARMPTAPKWTGAANFDYNLGDAGGWNTRLNGSWRFIDSQFSVISSQPPAGLLPSYSLVDLNLQCSTQRVSLSLYAKNLFDRRVFNFASPTTDNSTGASYFQGSVVQPRTLGVSVNVSL